MDKILIVEDNCPIQRVLTRLFEFAGYGVEVRADGASALAAFRSAAPSAIVLDLNLPAISGRDVCSAIKRERPALPVIVLTASTAMSEKFALLKMGADDFVTKPFSPRELLARVRAAIRRRGAPNVPDITGFDAIFVDFAKMQVMREDSPVILTATQFKILKFFVQNAERIISRDELLHLLGYNCFSQTIDNHILGLRHKLERDPANPVHFRTVRGAGFRFVP